MQINIDRFLSYLYLTESLKRLCIKKMMHFINVKNILFSARSVWV